MDPQDEYLIEQQSHLIEQQSEPVRLSLKVHVDQLDFVCQEMSEVEIHSESKLTEKWNLTIDQLQQPSASPVAFRGSESAAEPPVSTVSLLSLHFSSPEQFSGELHFEYGTAPFSSDRV